MKCEGTLLKVCQVVTEDIFPSVILSDLFPLQKASFDACQNAFLLNLLCWQVPYCVLAFSDFATSTKLATMRHFSLDVSFQYLRLLTAFQRFSRPSFASFESWQNIIIGLSVSYWAPKSKVCGGLG